VRLDLSVFEAALYCATLRHGTSEPADTSLYPGNDIFETADGRVVTLALVEEHFWQAFVERVGLQLPALRDDRFATMQDRRRHAIELDRMLREVMRGRSAQAWAELFAGSDVPFEPCVTPAEAARSPHVTARGRVDEVDGATYVPFPVTVDGGVRPRVHRRAPGLGEHGVAFAADLTTSGDARDPFPSQSRRSPGDPPGG
jgi:crotonobetainyl-CoA:carnitine CoA-transferase CaiB-like acyl-CoA transferase